ncbi:hypothetical protein Tco_0472769 [Tanacetum coccineum]
MFDEYFNPPTIVVSPVPVADAPRAIDLADSPVSMSIDQYAPSTRCCQKQKRRPGKNVAVDPNTPQSPKKRGRPTGSGKNQPTAIVDETVGDKEVWDTVKFTDEKINELKAKYGQDHKKIIDEHINKFLDDMFNRTKKELLVNKDKKLTLLKGCLVLGIISKGKQVEVIVISNDDTEDDEFSVSDSEDDESEAYDDTKEDAFSVSDFEDDESEADDDTDVMWVLPYKSHASTSKVRNFKELKDKRKKNSSEVKKPTSDLKRPYSEVRITDCVLNSRAPRSGVGCSSNKKGCSGVFQQQKGCSGMFKHKTEEVVMGPGMWPGKVLGIWFPQNGFVGRGCLESEVDLPFDFLNEETEELTKRTKCH